MTCQSCMSMRTCHIWFCMTIISGLMWYCFCWTTTSATGTLLLFFRYIPYTEGGPLQRPFTCQVKADALLDCCFYCICILAVRNGRVCTLDREQHAFATCQIILEGLPFVDVMTWINSFERFLVNSPDSERHIAYTYIHYICSNLCNDHWICMKQR